MLAYGVSYFAPPRVTKIRIRALSEEDVRRQSCVRVTEVPLYTRGIPTAGGLNDTRMGTTDRRILCGTCGKDMRCCQGHIGHIELPFPLYHATFFDTVLRLLRCSCFFCSRGCLTEQDLQSPALSAASGKHRLAAAHAVLRVRKRCPHCDAPRPSYVKAPIGIRAEWPADVTWESEEEEAHCRRIFTQRDALSILDNMPSADAALLGFDPPSRPRNLVTCVLAVPPPCARPSLASTEGSRNRGQDDMTQRLQDVLKRCNEVRTGLAGADWRTAELGPDLLERINRLQTEVLTLVSPSARGQRPTTHRTGAPLKSIVERVKGKEGRIRGNLMGKRTDFCARSVISPGPFLDVDEVGVPRCLATQLTVPEKATPLNLDRLRERVHVGADQVGGAAVVISPDGDVIQLSQCAARRAVPLAPGWTVERYLEDGDVVAFNRQPSLHKMGMMGHRVRLVGDKTFRINLSVTSAYNADFDGDEMNCFVPQPVASRANVATLMLVSEQLLSPQGNRPCVGVVQDSLLGAHLLTRGSELLTREEASRLVAALRHYRVAGGEAALPPPAVRARGRPLWTGKQLISLLFPPELHLDAERRAPVRSMADLSPQGRVVVRAGRLLSGRLGKPTLGTASGGIVDVICRDLPAVRAARLVSDLQRMVLTFMSMRGFNVGIDDCVVGSAGARRVRERMDMAASLADDISAHLAAEAVSREQAEGAEATIRRILARALTQSGAIVEEELRADNAIATMVACGSKGSSINLSQIGGCVGQQSVEGRRIESVKGTRTLPCFERNDTSLRSKGLVRSSYADGLDPAEFFFHAMGGREGLVDTAVKTATTGYIQRKQIKSMESHRVHADGSVRNASRDVVQLVYCGHGFEPSKLERVPMEGLLRAPAEEVRRAHGAERGARILALRREVLGALLAEPGLEAVDWRVPLPVNAARLVERRLGRRRRRRTEDGPTRAAVDALLDSVAYAPLRLHLEAELGGVVPLHDPAEAAALLDEVRVRIEAAAVAPGEMVGCIAAQSIGEPATQMTLNTFHNAGNAAKNVTLGIPRLQELLTVSKNMKTPCTTLRFRAPLRRSAELLRYFAETLPSTTLREVVLRTEFVLDPDLRSTRVEADAAMVADDLALEGPPCPHSFRVVVRLTLHQTLLRARRLAVTDVRRMLRRRLGDRAHVVSSEVNEPEWVVRIRFAQLEKTIRRSDHSAERMAAVVHSAVSVLLSTLVVSGRPSVASACERTEKQRTVTEAGDALEEDERVVDVVGLRLLDATSIAGAEWERCTTNDVEDVLDTLGIEAAAAVLFSELRNVISFDGTYVFPGHMHMIVDTMTREGRLKALNRFGVNRESLNALDRCSFEETPDILTDAAMYGEVSDCNGVSSNLMVGQRAEVGTGAVCVRFDTSMLPASMSAEVQITKQVWKSTVRPDTHEIEHESVFVEAVPDPAELEALVSSMMEEDREESHPYDEGGEERIAFESVPTEEHAFVFFTPPPSDDEG